MTHRIHHAPVSLVLAAAIAATLAGCGNGATSKSEVIAPVPFSQGANVAGQQSADVNGQVMFQGAPLANAQLKVLDAMTDEPAPVIAPGGGNLVTDADGRFHFQLTGIAPGQVVRVVASADGKTLSTLISGDGQSIDPGRSVQALGVSANLSEQTTLLSLMADGALRMSGMLQPKAASSIVADLFQKMRAQLPQLTSRFESAQLLAILGGLQPDTGALSATAAAQLNTMLANSGELQTWLDLNRSSLEAILQAIKTRSNLSPELYERLGRLQNVPLPGTGMTVSFDEHFLTVVDAGGTPVKVDLTNYAQLDAMASSPAFQKAFQAVSAAVAGQAAKK